MAKFKLEINADIELNEEESAEWLQCTYEQKAEYVARVIEGMKAVVEAESSEGTKIHTEVKFEEAEYL